MEFSYILEPLDGSNMSIQRCYWSAIAYQETGACLYLNKAESVSFLKYYLAPCVTNLAFSCELFLKILRYLDSKEGCRGHDLCDIFQMLCAEKRKQIEQRFEAYVKSVSVEDCLKMHAKVFEKFRYMHERKAESYTVNCDTLYYLSLSLMEVCGLYFEMDG